MYLLACLFKSHKLSSCGRLLPCNYHVSVFIHQTSEISVNLAMTSKVQDMVCDQKGTAD